MCEKTGMLRIQCNAEIRMPENGKSPKSESFDLRLREETSENQTNCDILDRFI